MDVNKRILVVDDSTTGRMLVMALLDQLGFKHTDDADGGRKALLKLRTSQYDVILCDWNMPEMEGLELLEEIKKDPSIDSDIPLIMITGEDSKERVLMAIESGVKGYILKPPTVEQIAANLENVI